MNRQMTRAEVLALPPTTDLPTLGRILGVSEPVIRERHRLGELEAMGIRVLRLGAKLRVVTSDIWRLLGIDATSHARVYSDDTPQTPGKQRTGPTPGPAHAPIDDPTAAQTTGALP